MRHTFTVVLLLTSMIALAEGCGKKMNGPESSEDQATTAVLADNPNARLSEVLQRLRGRWVKEVPDPRQPNPPMMRMFAVADNTLQGRLLFAGAFADTGVAAQLKQESDIYTLTLTDDELRAHDWIPKERVLTGTYDSATKALELKSREGEYMKFDLADPKLYALRFTGNVYRCIVVATPTPPTGSSGASGGTTTPSPAPTPAPPSGGEDARVRNRARLNFVLPGDDAAAVPHAELDSVAAAEPASTPRIPPARVAACGIMPSWEEDWSRMSGSGG